MEEGTPTKEKRVRRKVLVGVVEEIYDSRAADESLS